MIALHSDDLTDDAVSDELRNLGGELLALATQRQLRQIDEKLFFEAFAAPAAPQAKLATGRRR